MDLYAPLTAFSGRRPSQLPFELRSFIQLLQQRQVRSYLEIGAREGDTFVEIMESLPAGSRGVAVDLPGGLWGKLSTRSKLEKAVAHLQAKGYKASCLFGDSQTDATRRLVVGRGPYDAVLIDGDHTLEGVSRDFQLYGELADIVAFHDIVGEGMVDRVHKRPVEVPKLWASLKQRYAHKEFVEKGSCMGIGVIFPPEPEALP